MSELVSERKELANQFVASLLRKHTLEHEPVIKSTSLCSLSLDHKNDNLIGKLQEEEENELPERDSREHVKYKIDTLCTSSLKSLTDQVASFLSLAPNVPPVPMESSMTSLEQWQQEQEKELEGNHQDEEINFEEMINNTESTEVSNQNKKNVNCNSTSQQYVELNVVAGVLEPKSDTWKKRADSKDGILLPTAQTLDAFEIDKIREAKAMLSLLDALAPNECVTHTGKAVHSKCTSGTAANYVWSDEVKNIDNECNNAYTAINNSHNDRDYNDVTSDSDSSVVIMDADELNDNDSSDDEENCLDSKKNNNTKMFNDDKNNKYSTLSYHPHQCLIEELQSTNN